MRDRRLSGGCAHSAAALGQIRSRALERAAGCRARVCSNYHHRDVGRRHRPQVPLSFLDHALKNESRTPLSQFVRIIISLLKITHCDSGSATWAASLSKEETCPCDDISLWGDVWGQGWGRGTGLLCSRRHFLNLRTPPKVATAPVLYIVSHF